MAKYSDQTEEQKEVARAQARERYWRNREKYIERSRAIPKDVQRERNRVSRTRLKAEVYSHYGDKCVCCGEATPKFLSIDHVNGGGYQHRQAIGGGLALLYDIRKRGYPSEFQILCFNCNQGRQLNGGICPHKEEVNGTKHENAGSC